MLKLVSQFLRIAKNIADNNPYFVLKISTGIMLSIIILMFVIQYNNTVLDKKQKHMNKVILRIENDIKVLTSEYVSLISPYKLKQLSNIYLPSFENIKISDKVSVKQFK